MSVTFVNPNQWQDATLSLTEREEIKALFQRHAREDCRSHEYLPVFDVLDNGRRCAMLFKLVFEFECLPDKRKVLIYAVRYKPRPQRQAIYRKQPELVELGFVGDPDLRNFKMIRKKKH